MLMLCYAASLMYAAFVYGVFASRRLVLGNASLQYAWAVCYCRPAFVHS
jgi:hypothetical protein